MGPLLLDWGIGVSIATRSPQSAFDAVFSSLWRGKHRIEASRGDFRPYRGDDPPTKHREAHSSPLMPLFHPTARLRTQPSRRQARTYPSSVASTVISTFPRSAPEIGQFSPASAAAASNPSWSTPGTCPLTTR